jgi:hypothetical protein
MKINKRLLVKFLNPVLFFLALILVFEEWLWDQLTIFTQFLSKLPLLKTFEMKVKSWKPYPSLLFMISPFLLLIPFKLLVLKLLTLHQLFWAVVLFIFEKLLGTALVAHFFSLTRENVMTILWFKLFFDKLVYLILVSKNWLKSSAPYLLIQKVKIQLKARFSKNEFFRKRLQRIKRS